MTKLLIFLALALSCIAQPKRITPMMFVGDGSPDIACTDGNLYLRTDTKSGDELHFCVSGSWYKAGGNSTATISAGKYRDRGTCNTANIGQIVTFSDSRLQSYCDGSSWINSYLGSRLVLPWTDGSPVGGLVQNSDSGYITAKPGRGAGGHRWNMSLKSLPKPPYKVSLGAIPSGLWADNDRCGLVLRDSASGRFVTISPLVANGQQISLAIEKWSGISARDSVQYTLYNPISLLNGGMAFVSVEDTGKLRSYQFSSDNIDWSDLIGTSSSDFIKPDQYGYGCSAFGPNSNLTALFVHLNVE